MRKKLSVSLGVAWALWFGAPCGAVAAGLEVPLTVSERAGVRRVNEPVTSGVPLPRGAVSDVRELQLLDSTGKPVPAQFQPACKWWPGGKSVRWVLVDFQASVPAGGKASFTLIDGGRATPPAVPVTVTAEKDRAVVKTGVLKFVVRRDKFNLIDEAWLDSSGKGQYDSAHQVVASHDGGPTVFTGSTRLPAYWRHTPANDPQVTLTVEEAGPMRAVLKLTGRHLAGDAPEDARRALDFVCRIHAYAGTSRLKVVYTLECRQGESLGEPTAVDRIWLTLPVKLKADAADWAVGLPGGDAIWRGGPKDKWPKPAGWGADRVGEIEKYTDPGHNYVRVFAEHSGKVRYEGDFFRFRPLTVNPKADKPAARTIGWVDVADARHGLAAGIRWFWQMFPKEVRAGGNTVVLSLLPNFAHRPDLVSNARSPVARFYPGMSRTHEMMLYFHGPRDVRAIVSAFAGLQAPLFAAAPPDWYCQQTRGLGKVASGNPDLYPPEHRAVVKAYDRAYKDSWRRIVAHRDQEFGEYDSYGFFNFGDSINYIHPSAKHNPRDRDVGWDNNYYGYPHALLVQFARTGDLDYLETAVEAQTHLMDVDQVVWHPTNPDLVGCNRYCDGGMHIRTSVRGGIVASPTFNHYKVEGSFERFYLTGERRAWEMALLGARYAQRNPRRGGGSSRAPGHGMIGNLAGYEATGDVGFLRSAKVIVERHLSFTRSKNGAWIDGILHEGLRRFHEVTGDPRPVATVIGGADAFLAAKDFAGAGMHTFGFAYGRTGDRKYLDVLLKRLPRAAEVKSVWGGSTGLANNNRNCGAAMWYLTKDLPKKEEVPRLDISVHIHLIGQVSASTPPDRVLSWSSRFPKGQVDVIGEHELVAGIQRCWKLATDVARAPGVRVINAIRNGTEECLQLPLGQRIRPCILDVEFKPWQPVVAILPTPHSQLYRRQP